MQARLDGAALHLQRERDQQIFHAWHVAALMRAKRLPRLDTLFRKGRRGGAKAARWQDQLKTVEFINAAMGGFDKRKN